MALDLTDKTSNGNTLTNHGATEVLTSLPYAASIRAADLVAASTQYLSAADSTSLSITSQLTIEFWLKFTSLPAVSGTIYMVSKRDDAGTDGGYGFGIRNIGGTIKPLGVANQSADSTTRDIYEWSWAPSTATWYHLALTIDATQPSASTMELFIDGVSQGNGSAVVAGNISSIRDAAAALTIGAELQLGSPANPTDAKFDDVRVWNTIRTGTQIAANRSSNLVGTETGLAAYWPFESLATTTSTSTTTSTTTTSTSSSTSSSTTTTSTSSSTSSSTTTTSTSSSTSSSTTTTSTSSSTSSSTTTTSTSSSTSITTSTTHTTSSTSTTTSSSTSSSTTTTSTSSSTSSSSTTTHTSTSSSITTTSTSTTTSMSTSSSTTMTSTTITSDLIFMLEGTNQEGIEDSFTGNTPEL